MVAPAIDISLLGAKELENALKKLPDIVQKRIVRSSLLKVAKRVHKETLARVPVDTGRLKAGLAAENKPVLQKRQNAVVYYLNPPTRAFLGIAPDYEWYYPWSLEFGYTRKDGFHVPPHPYIRPAVDENMDIYHGMMRRDINKGIVRNMKRLAKK